MDNFKNNKSTMGDAAKKEHTFMIQNDASPSKFQHNKMGVSLALLTKKIFNKWHHQVTIYNNRFHGVVVITPDSESGNLGSSPGGTYIF